MQEQIRACLAKKTQGGTLAVGEEKGGEKEVRAREMAGTRYQPVPVPCEV